MCPSPKSPGEIAGVSIPSTIKIVAGDIVGRDKITYGLTAEELVEVLEARGFIRTAENAGLERRTIINLAQRVKPDDVLDFDQAIRELERAVAVALDLVARGKRGTNHDDFVNAVLADVANKTRIGDLDGGATTIDQGIAKLAATHRRSRVVLLEEGVKVDTLRRDAIAVARRIETLVDLDHSSKRPAWLPAFREQYEMLYEEGEARGLSFSLSIAVEMARRLLATARNGTERGTAANLLGAALSTLGERESGTARLEEAVAAYRAALEEYTRERVPLGWAATQNNLGIALQRLGERENGPARLEASVSAYREALEEYTRERVPLDWAVTQNNLGAALSTLGGREGGTARLEEAVEACRAALEERTRERGPLRWANTQTNLGTALRALGERESGRAGEHGWWKQSQPTMRRWRFSWLREHLTT
jgi:tetratricopeptide (TPR) repeat protein